MVNNYHESLHLDISFTNKIVHLAFILGRLFHAEEVVGHF